MISKTQRARAAKKLKWIEKYYPPIRKGKKFLDLGCAEGFIGEACEARYGGSATLVDVVDMNKTNLPLHLYDGKKLDFENQSFDICFLIFVLHHAVDSEQVLREACRVAKTVIIMESVYESDWDLKQLTFLDKAVNRLRSKGKMTEQEEYLNFRRDVEWLSIFGDLNLDLVGRAKRGRFIHQQSLFIVES